MGRGLLNVVYYAVALNKSCSMPSVFLVVFFGTACFENSLKLLELRNTVRVELTDGAGLIV